MKTFRQLLVCAIILLISGCQSFQTPAIDGPRLKHAVVQGFTLNYLEQGQGVPVVFVHGAFSDHRNWEAQRSAISKRYRYIALDQRYFGTAPWLDNAAKYSVATHASDLATFIQHLNVGPVHVVGWSYGGAVALVLASQRPDLIQSLFLNEPALGSIVSDPAEQKTLAEERRGTAPAVAASRSNDQPHAVQLFADWVNDQPGSFQALPMPMRNVHLENARTLPAHFAAPLPPAIACAQLGQLKVPVTIATGQQTRPFFAILANAAHRCISGSQLIVIPNSRHMAPAQNPPAFNAALLAHLDRR